MLKFGCKSQPNFKHWHFKNKSPANGDIDFTTMNNAIKAAPLKEVDEAVFDAIKAETNRQQTHIELIASENFVIPAVMEAMGSTLTNKYAEGYPGKRYYGGCEFVDVVEQLAIDRAKKYLAPTT